jgi:alkaline phosphatase D
MFANADIDWFVMDCRTERILAGRDKRMIGVAQEQALLKWLVNSTARVKFIVSSVMFMPDQRRDSDGWKAFTTQRNRILETIRSNAVKNVVFVSGDIHGSLCCQLTHDKSPDFIVHSVVSSPLCNTRLLPYANVGDLLVNTPLTTVGTGTYSLTLNSRVVSEDNFACLTITGQQLKVDFHNKKGRIIETATIALK